MDSRGEASTRTMAIWRAWLGRKSPPLCVCWNVGGRPAPFSEAYSYLILLRKCVLASNNGVCLHPWLRTVQRALYPLAQHVTLRILFFRVSVGDSHQEPHGNCIHFVLTWRGLMSARHEGLEDLIRRVHQKTKTVSHLRQKGQGGETPKHGNKWRLPINRAEKKDACTQFVLLLGFAASCFGGRALLGSAKLSDPKPPLFYQSALLINQWRGGIH